VYCRGKILLRLEDVFSKCNGRRNPEDRELNFHRRENLISHKIKICYTSFNE